VGIGVGIVLLAIGAILTFAVDAQVNGLDIEVVGVILMIAGAVGLLLDLVVFAPRRRSTVIVDDPVSRRTVRRDDVL
jgi:hypothetical protein